MPDDTEILGMPVVINESLPSGCDAALVSERDAVFLTGVDHRREIQMFPAPDMSEFVAFQVALRKAIADSLRLR